MLLVCDSSAALRIAAGGLSVAADLIAPPLLWSEVLSAVHEAMWRQEIDAGQAAAIRDRFEACGIRRDAPRQLHAAAWTVAEELGLAKTYDAEFLGLARLRSCRVLTTDLRLRRAADRLGLVVGPSEL